MIGLFCMLKFDGEIYEIISEPINREHDHVYVYGRRIGTNKLTEVEMRDIGHICSNVDDLALIPVIYSKAM